MNKVAPEIFEYLKTERTGVLAVEMLDGSPHAATVHFSHSENPFIFYFETYRESRKAKVLLNKTTVRASFVVGTVEQGQRTLQLDGEIRVLGEQEREAFNEVYLNKFPEKVEKSKDPKFLFLEFKPLWWRFTDWHTSEGKKIWTSE
jgi:uncharacterized protein YhbP (UPF0306 family)